MNVTSKERAQERAGAVMQEKMAPIIGAVERKLASWDGKSAISVDRERNWDYAAIQEVISLYKAVGWNAKLQCSQREGDWIELS